MSKPPEDVTLSFIEDGSLKELFIIISLFVYFVPLGAQDRFELSMVVRPKRERIPQKTIEIYQAPSQLVLDGVLDEPAWQQADKAFRFQQYFPMDTGSAVSRTEAVLTYDHQNLYVGVNCYDQSKGNYIVQSLRRDFFDLLNDHIVILIDPYNNLNNGFAFGLTPLGVQMEGLISGGDNVNTTWDNIWYSEVTQNDSGWVAEIKIPFKSFRYDNQQKNWNIQFVRNDLQRNERSTWTSVERQFRSSSLAFSGRLKWEAAPPKAGANITFIPYLSGALNKDIENNLDLDVDGNAGFDGKVALSSALNLDLTFNPDFSTVEVDDQLTNITRFELFFPEKRQFFLENSDLFGNYGFGRSSVFFSRRIGISSPMLYGARLSGQLAPGLRIGFLNAQTRHLNSNEGSDIPALNSTVLTFQKQLVGQSTLGVVFTNQQTLNIEKDQQEGYDFGDARKYNRVFGLQYNLLSQDNKWEGQFFATKSIDPENHGDSWSHGAFLRYNTPRLNAHWVHEFIGTNYNAELGFVPRKGLFRISPSISYQLPIESHVINQQGPGLSFTQIWDREWSKTDHYLELDYDISFNNTSRLQFGFRDSFTKLFEDFDPTGQSDQDPAIEPLPNGSSYRWQEAGLSYRSDRRQDFSFQIESGYGGFYNGTRYEAAGNIGYRLRPFLGIHLVFSFDKIELPDPYGDASFWLLGPQVDLTLTDNIFWTNYLQYNEQADNINLNSRLQWRFAPVSDLFVVYSENYLPDGFMAKNRSLVLKVSYWINL